MEQNEVIDWVAEFFAKHNYADIKEKERSVFLRKWK